MKKLQYERPVLQRLNAGTMNKFGTRTEFDPVSHIDNVSVKSLIKAIRLTLVCYFGENNSRNLQAGHPRI